MGYYLEEACNGCEECRRCRLAGETHKVFYCDECGNYLETSELRRYNGEDVCQECFLSLMEEEWDKLPEVKEDQL